MSKQNKLLITKQHLHSAVLNLQGSKAFLKQIVPLSASFILHQRVEFDGKNFQTATYDGVKYQTFKEKLQNATLKDVRSWLNSAMEVLDKNYLREMYLILASINDPTMINESYKFQFKYLGDDVIKFDISSTEEELGESTNDLLNAIESLSEHTKYKENDLDIKLAVTYYEDILPDDYVPDLFTGDDEVAAVLQKSLKQQSSDYMLLGVLKSRHHELKCRGKGEVFSTKDATRQSMEELESQEVITLENNEDELQNNKESEVQNDDEGELNNLAVRSPSLEFERRYTGTPTISELSANENLYVRYEPIRCLCKISTSFEYIEQIKCSSCSNIQHCACEGYLHQADVPQPYVCGECTHFSTDYTPTKEHTKKLISVYKLATAIAYYNKSFPKELYLQLESLVQRFLITKWEKFNIITKKDNEYTINLNLLENKHIQIVFAKSFSNKRETVSDNNAEEGTEEVKGKKQKTE